MGTRLGMIPTSRRLLPRWTPPQSSAGPAPARAGREAAQRWEMLVRAFISRISPLALETGNLPFPQRAFCPRPALQAHQGKIPRNWM